MTIPENMTKRLIGAVAIAALMVSAGMAWRVFGRGHAPCGSCGAEWRPREHLSQEFNDSMTALYASRLKRQLNDAESGRFVESIQRHAANLPWQYTTSALSSAEEEASSAVGFSYALISDRLRYGGVSEVS
ncbi:MAG: hypothetical protein IBJ10_02035 [Phycisphaerales bacterium]|nr:hypothetical protein [Phycisphaerales bacterium]